MFIESFKEAVNWRKTHRQKLTRGSRHQRRVARTLRKCRPRHRCGTEACRLCMRDFRISLLGEAIKIMVQRPHWTRCSIITKGLLVPYGQLAKFDLNAAVKRIRKRLERSDARGRIVLGALDISLNLSSNVIVGWQLHLYLIVEGENDGVLQQAIRAALQPEPTALAPYDFAEVRAPVEAITYAYKALFKRRSAYNTSQGNCRVKDQPLKGADLRELLPFLARYKVGARLIVCGVRRNGQRLVFTPRKRSAAQRKCA